MNKRNLKQLFDTKYPVIDLCVCDLYRRDRIMIIKDCLKYNFYIKST